MRGNAVTGRGGQGAALTQEPGDERHRRMSDGWSNGVRPLSGESDELSTLIPSAKGDAILRSRHDSARLGGLDPQRILIGLLCPIGDTLFATPAVAALRRRFPAAHITALVKRSNAGILEGNPDIDERLVPHSSAEGPRWLSLAQRVDAIKRSPYDLMVSFSPAASFMGFLAGVPEQVHLQIPRLWWLVGGHDEAHRDRHAVDHYLHAIRPLLDADVPEHLRQPRVYLSSKHRAAARRMLRERGFSASQLLIAMHAGADGFGGRKRWSTKRFAAVGRQLVQRFDAQVLLMGGQDDATLADEVATGIGLGATVLAGHTSLMESAALIERAALFIGNDSGLLHIAAAVGTPAVGIYGPSSVRQFHPVGGPGYRQRVLHSDLPCSPCFHFVGDEIPWVPNLCHSYACLKAIPADDVIEAATALLAQSALEPERSVPGRAR
jgi:lipopolysaccharide heptosyltransferase II